MKYVIDTVELKKRQYVIDAYSEKEAIDKMEDAEPVLQHIVSDSIFNIHTINEYEYTQDWQPLDPDIGPDQLKIFDE